MMGLRTITGYFFASSKYVVTAPAGRLPIDWTARILFLRNRSNTIETFWPLYEYFVANWSKSDSWQVGVSRAVGLFWDYCQTRAQQLPSNWSAWNRNRELLRGFAQALMNGTISNCTDPLELYWLPQTVDFARRTISALENFANWTELESGERLSLTPDRRHRCTRGGNLVETILSARKRGISLLGYLHGTDHRADRIASLPPSRRGFNREADYMLTFPPAYIEPLLWDGFIRTSTNGNSWSDYKIRDMMICILQAYAGLREHEPFHIWVNDVVEDPERPGHSSVFLYHPENGLAYVDDEHGIQRRTTRAIKLKEDFLLTPRTRGVGSYRVGWKNSKTITRDQYAVLYWTDPIASALFWQLYLYYVPYRAMVMGKRRALGMRDHPFLFVTEREARGRVNGHEFIGAPASIESYEDALRVAVRTVGLKSAKELGTTSQGLRHLYAYTLRALGVSQKTMQEGLRHRHPYSQFVYGNPTPSEINAAIEQCRERGRELLPPGIALDRTMRILDERFREYRTGRGGLA